MSFLRNKHQTILADLHARGDELVQRYAAEDGQALAKRLGEADAEWLEGVEQALQEDWSKAEITLIERLASHLRWSLQVLNQASMS